MKTYTLDQETPPWLAELVDAALSGEEVMLTDQVRPVARIVPLAPQREREGNGPDQAVGPKAGCLKGFWMSPDFDEPLEEFRDYME
jgi:hypothetical protein